MSTTNPTNTNTVLVDEHGDIIDDVVDLSEVCAPYISPAKAMEAVTYVVMAEHNGLGGSRISNMYWTNSGWADAQSFADRLNEDENGCYYRVYKVMHGDANEMTSENQRLAAENERLRDRIQQVEEDAQEDMTAYIQRAEQEMGELRREINMWRDMFGCVVRYVAQGVEDADEGDFNGELLTLSKVQSFMQGVMAKANVDEGMFD